MLVKDRRDEKGDNINSIVSWFIHLSEHDSIGLGGIADMYFHRYTPLIPVPFQTTEPVLLGGLTVSNNILSWYSSCENLNLIFKECCLMVSVALGFKLVYEVDRQPSVQTKEFHYLRNGTFKSISKNGLFGNFLPFIFSLGEEALSKERKVNKIGEKEKNNFLNDLQIIFLLLLAVLFLGFVFNFIKF